MAFEDFKKNLLKGDFFKDILGQEPAKKQIKSALVADRHIIIEGVPGIGKTTLVKSIAKHLPKLEVIDDGFNSTNEKPVSPQTKVALEKGEKLPTKVIEGDERFFRIQGSPDLTVEDLIGDIDPAKALEFGPQSIEAFTPGKIFKANNGILFFDEVNRAPEKLQNALLQVLEEGIATVGSYDLDIPTNFIFIGTMNPEDSSGTESLSDVFLDRVDVIKMTYPETADIEKEILTNYAKKIEGVEFDEEILNVLVSFIRSMRDSDKLERHPSVRASMGLYERTMANALVRGGTKTEFIDLKESFETVLPHRIKLKPSLKYLMSSSQFIDKELSSFVENTPEFSKFANETGSSSEPEGP